MFDLDTIVARAVAAEATCTRCHTPGETRPNAEYLVRATTHDQHPVLARLCSPCVEATVEGRGVVEKVTHTSGPAWDGTPAGESK